MIRGTRDERTEGQSGHGRPGGQLGRGQTTVDFAISIGLFLIALTVVISFLPGLIDPFAGTPSENPLVADRIANQLVNYQLAGDAPGTLNTTCTLYFFNTTESSNPCASFESDEELDEKLGINENIRVNVTVEQSAPGGVSEPLCGDRAEYRVLDGEDCDPGDDNQYLLTVGETPPHGGTVAVARRGAYLDGRQSVTLYVRVWQIT